MSTKKKTLPLPTDPLNVSDLIDHFAMILSRHGLSFKKISSILNCSQAKIKECVGKEKAEIADAAGSAIRHALPDALRSGAFHYLAESMRPERVAQASLRDLIFAAGVMLERAEQMERGAAQPGISLLVQLQGRVDQAEIGRLLGLNAPAATPITVPAEQPTEVIAVPVQPCPTQEPDPSVCPKKRYGLSRHPLGKRA